MPEAVKRNRNFYLDDRTFVKFKKTAAEIGSTQETLSKLMARNDDWPKLVEEVERLRSIIENPGTPHVYPPR